MQDEHTDHRQTGGNVDEQARRPRRGLGSEEHGGIDPSQGASEQALKCSHILSQEVKMRPVTVAIAAALYMLGLSPVMAQQAETQVPQSIRLQHEQIISRLNHFSESRDRESAAAAQKALIFLKEHYAKEEQFVLPTLGLLPRIAQGEISKDMETAITMADRTKSALADFQNDHIKITELMNELISVGRKKKNDELVRLATRVAAQSLNDIEVNQPTTILIGDYLRQRLSRP